MKFLIDMCQVAFCVVLLCRLMPAAAQEVTIYESESRDPVPDVAIYNTDRSKTVLSDFYGKADLAVFDADERITLKHLGYQTKRGTKAQFAKKGNLVFLTVDPEQLDEVVLSISKWEQQKRNIPQKISTITARDIEFNNPQTAADLLQNSGQVFVQKSQLGGGSPMIRGFATNRLLLSVDGVRMNNAIFRGGNLQNVISIDPFIIKSTEVIFGPGSVIYGSDAIGGVMNFLTNQARFAEKDTLHFSGHANYRHATANSENTGHIDFNFGKRRWAFLSSISYNNFGDLKMGKHGPTSYLRESYVTTRDEMDFLVANTSPRIQLPTGYDQLSLMQKVSHKPSNNLQYDLGLYYSETSDYSRYDRLIRPNMAGDGLRSAEWYYGPQRWFMGNFQVTKKGRGKFYDGVKVTAAYQRFEESRNERDFQDPVRFSTKERVDAFSANIDLENKRVGDLRLYYGAEYIFNRVGSEGSQLDIQTGSKSDGPSRYPDGSSWQTIAGYLNAEYKAKPNFTFLSGLRYSHVWLDAVFDKTFFPFPFDTANLSNGSLTGSLGLSWFPKADLNVTVNGSTGFRSPNIDDVGKVFDSEPGAVVVPNPNLLPEYAYNGEVGLKKNFKDKLVLKGAAFYTYLVDALVRRDYQFNGQNEIFYNGELSRVQAIQNAAKANVYGIEMGAEAFVSDHLSLTSNFTLTKGIEEDDNGVDTPLRHAAPAFGDFHITWTDQKWKADVFLNYNGEIAFEDLTLSERSKEFIYAVDAEGNPYSPAWYTLNLRSQYNFSNALKATMALENITDQRYRTYSSGIVAAGTNLVLGLGYTF